MPIPGLTPADLAPPPGSQSQIATAANIARLLQKIADLERRVAMLERK